MTILGLGPAPVNQPTVLDLFSGIGGFSLGLERAGFKTVAFCEIDPFCRQVLQKHWPNTPIHPDILELEPASLPRPSLICGGFPCQDISHAGRMAGLRGAKSGLWSEFRRLVGGLRPGWVLAENSSMGRRSWVPDVRRDLSELGYYSTAADIAAYDIGAPHERRRCWVLAHASRQRCELASAAISAGGASPELRAGWRTEPGFRRVADGVPRRVDRLRSLGNSIVPQIAELIGRAILAAEASS